MKRRRMKRPYGYIISGTRLKDGRLARTLKSAKKEMLRQMRTGATSSGIGLVATKEGYEIMKKKGWKEVK